MLQLLATCLQTRSYSYHPQYEGYKKEKDCHRSFRDLFRLLQLSRYLICQSGGSGSLPCQSGLMLIGPLVPGKGIQFYWHPVAKTGAGMYCKFDWPRIEGYLLLGNRYQG